MKRRLGHVASRPGRAAEVPRRALPTNGDDLISLRASVAHASSIARLHSLPRSKQGVANTAPFNFFNVLDSNQPIAAFSPGRA